MGRGEAAPSVKDFEFAASLIPKLHLPFIPFITPLQTPFPVQIIGICSPTTHAWILAAHGAQYSNLRIHSIIDNNRVPVSIVLFLVHALAHTPAYLLL